MKRADGSTCVWGYLAVIDGTGASSGAIQHHRLMASPQAAVPISPGKRGDEMHGTEQSGGVPKGGADVTAHIVLTSGPRWVVSMVGCPALMQGEVRTRHSTSWPLVFRGSYSLPRGIMLAMLTRLPTPTTSPRDVQSQALSTCCVLTCPRTLKPCKL